MARAINRRPGRSGQILLGALPFVLLAAAYLLASDARLAVNPNDKLLPSPESFAAAIEPKIIQREQNRVDLVFEIAEGPKTKIARINFLGNERFSDGDLRGKFDAAIQSMKDDGSLNELITKWDVASTF